MIDMTVDFAGIKLRGPVALASGTCGFGRELAELADLSNVGAICSKGLTLSPRGGNDGTRVHETPSGLMNSIGLENPGVEKFIERELPFMRTLGPAVIVNLGGHCEDDYLRALELLRDESFDMLELNISCPNVHAGGVNFGSSPETARPIVRSARKIFSGKMMVKLSPNSSDIAATARACEEEGADAISLVNTFLGMAIDVERRRAVFDNIYAGLSGPAIRPIALRMVHTVAHAVSIPVMGLGGISTARDAIEFIMAGATAVQVGTATLVDPNAAAKITSGIADFMRAHEISRLDEIRGIV